MQNSTSKRLRYITLGVAFVFCVMVNLLYGQVPWSLAYQGFIERLTGTSHQWNPILDERIPRLIVTVCTGASLATSGLVMQSLFQNPLASPSILGTSCGGSLCVTLVYVFDWQFQYPFSIPIAAIFGCLVALLLVYGLSQVNGHLNINTLILTGIAISTLLIACQGVIMYALRENWHLIQVLTEWEAGSTMDRSWKHVNMQVPLTLIGLYGCWYYRRELDILALGSEEALNLGVDVSIVRWRLFLCVALLVGGALAAVGIIAFFGLVLPHLFRNLFGPQNNQLVPLCSIGGAMIFTSLDLILRIGDIHTLSIGNISAIIGGMFFLILLFRSKRRTAEVYGG
ncbi:MAG: iron ABC transporter permease [Chlamydiota bacterium]